MRYLPGWGYSQNRCHQCIWMTGWRMCPHLLHTKSQLLLQRHLHKVMLTMEVDFLSLDTVLRPSFHHLITLLIHQFRLFLQKTFMVMFGSFGIYTGMPASDKILWHGHHACFCGNQSHVPGHCPPWFWRNWHFWQALSARILTWFYSSCGFQYFRFCQIQSSR